MRKKLGDEVYQQEIERLSHLQSYPHLPRTQQDLRKAMRRTTDCDEVFLHRVISEFVDAGTPCPTPHELQEKASEIRRRGVVARGRADCPDCHGTGWVRKLQPVQAAGFDAYEAECSVRCKCVAAAKGAA